MAANPHPPAAAQQAALGLRERKKLKTRIAIRQAAYLLIADHGYEATTIEQIAEAAEVSPSTVFRYFPTKEDIVLTDEYDRLMVEALRSRPLDEPPVASLRLVMRQALNAMLADGPDDLAQRTGLMIAVPAVRTRMTETMSATGRLLTDVLAERAGRDPGDLELRVLTTTALTALREVSLYWGERGGQDDLLALLDRALDTLADGLRL